MKDVIFGPNKECFVRSKDLSSKFSIIIIKVQLLIKNQVVNPDNYRIQIVGCMHSSVYVYKRFKKCRQNGLQHRRVFLFCAQDKSQSGGTLCFSQGVPLYLHILMMNGIYTLSFVKIREDGWQK